MGTVAATYSRQGREDEALAGINTMIDGYRKAARADPNAGSILTALFEAIRLVCAIKGNNVQAEKLVETILDIAESESGDWDQTTLIAMTALGDVYAVQNKYREAQETYKRVLEIQREVLDKGHPRTQSVMRSLARAYDAEYRDLRVREPNMARNAAEQAVRLYIDWLALFRGLLRGNETTPQARTVMGGLVIAYAAAEDYARAEMVATNLLDIQRQTTGVQQAAVAKTLGVLGWMQFQQQKYAEADVNTSEAVRTYERAGTNSWERYNAVSVRGVVLVAGGRYAEAEPCLIEAYEKTLQLKPVLGEGFYDDVSTGEEIPGERILKLYEKWNKPQREAEWRQRIQADESLLQIRRITPLQQASVPTAKNVK